MQSNLPLEYGAKFFHSCTSHVLTNQIHSNLLGMNSIHRTDRVSAASMHTRENKAPSLSQTQSLCVIAGFYYFPPNTLVVSMPILVLLTKVKF